MYGRSILVYESARKLNHSLRRTGPITETRRSTCRTCYALEEGGAITVTFAIPEPGVHWPDWPVLG